MIRLNFNNDPKTLLEPNLPVKTDTYTPISNREIINLIEEECQKNNLVISNRNYKSTIERDKFIGLFDITGDDPELGMRLAFKNSYDKSMSFGFAVGACVFICSNGMVSGEITLKRKHTGEADIEAKEKIIFGVSKISETFEKMKQDRTRMKEYYINSKVNAELIGRLYLEEGIINSVQLNIIKDRIHNSDMFKTVHDESYTIWDMYNHITGALKTSHPSTFMRDHIKLHSFIKSIV